jgi:hypothetical protein
MRGKILFITGGLVGYVLGARAGRKRYDQIAEAASNVWHAEPVQRRVNEMRDFTLDKIGDSPSTLFATGKKIVSSLQSATQSGAKAAASKAKTAQAKADAAAKTAAEAAEEAAKATAEHAAAVKAKAEDKAKADKAKADKAEADDKASGTDKADGK